MSKEKAPMQKKLTPKQKRFVQEYLIDLNATQAAIRAGYAKNTAKEQGYECLTKPHVKQAIKTAQRGRLQRTQITQDKVLSDLVRLKDIGFGDEPMPEGANLQAADRALEKLGKHVGLFEQVSQQKAQTVTLSMDFGGKSGGQAQGSGGNKGDKQALDKTPKKIEINLDIA